MFAFVLDAEVKHFGCWLTGVWVKFSLILKLIVLEIRQQRPSLAKEPQQIWIRLATMMH